MAAGVNVDHPTGDAHFARLRVDFLRALTFFAAGAAALLPGNCSRRLFTAARSAIDNPEAARYAFSVSRAWYVTESQLRRDVTRRFTSSRSARITASAGARRPCASAS